MELPFYFRLKGAFKSRQQELPPKVAVIIPNWLVAVTLRSVLLHWMHPLLNCYSNLIRINHQIMLAVRSILGSIPECLYFSLFHLSTNCLVPPRQ